MVKRVTLSLLVAVSAVASAEAVASELKTADEVIAKYIEAVGGRKALKSITTLRATGKNTMGPGMEMPMVIEQKRPGKLRVEITFQGQTAVQAFDGETGWFVMPFMGKTTPEKMPSEQIDQFRSEADMDGPLVDYAKKGHKVELIGKEDIEGTETYKLKVTQQDGSILYFFLDAEYFLPIKIKGKRLMQGTEIEFEATLGDYKEVAGVMIPHSLTQQAAGMGMNSTMTFEKIEVNVDIPDSRFAMPEAKAVEKPKVEEKPAGEPSTKKTDDK